MLDGHTSHCTREFIEHCDANDIIPLCLPSHSTHLLQPLDVRVFQPYKYYHSEAIEEATRLGCADFDKLEFLASLKSIREKTFKKSTILSAFRACGLWPYAPDVVLDKLRESLPETEEIPDESYWDLVGEYFSDYGSDSERQLPCLQQTPEPDTHDGVNELKTPKTVRSLKRMSDKISSSTFSSPSKRQMLEKFQKGSMIQATAGGLALKHMNDTSAAKAARDRRTRAGRKRVQGGGILYASQARSMIKDREDEEVRKAQAVLKRAANKKAREEQRVEKEREKEEKAREREEKARKKVEQNKDKERVREEKQREKEAKAQEKLKKAALTRFQKAGVFNSIEGRRGGFDRWLEFVDSLWVDSVFGPTATYSLPFEPDVGHFQYVLGRFLEFPGYSGVPEWRRFARVSEDL